MQELPLGGQCAPTGGAPLSQKPGSWLASAVVVAGASPASTGVLRMPPSAPDCERAQTVRGLRLS